jgi:WD40 repeat protein
VAISITSTKLQANNAVSAPFDPYRHWLDIRSDEVRTHYRLLAVRLFESDLAVIQAAADRQMKMVHGFEAGEHAELARRILDELEVAKSCLLNPHQKAAYDEQVRAELRKGPGAGSRWLTAGLLLAGLGVLVAAAFPLISWLGRAIQPSPVGGPPSRQQTSPLRDEGFLDKAVLFPTVEPDVTGGPEDSRPPSKLPIPSQEVEQAYGKLIEELMDPAATKTPLETPDTAPALVSRRLFLGHEAEVRSVAFSPDTKLLASGGADRQVMLWDIESGELERVLLGHENTVTSVAFSPDGQTLASASDDGTVRVWKLNHEQQVAVLEGPGGCLLSLAYAPDGKTIACGSGWRTREPKIRLWSTDGYQELTALQRHTGHIWSVVFSPDGQTLASGSADNTVRLWDTETFEERQVLHGHKGWVWSVAYSPDGSLLASGGGDHTVKLWDAHTGGSRASLSGHKNGVRTVRFSPDGRVLASGADDQTIRLWNPEHRLEQATLQGHTRGIWCVAFSPDGTMLASASLDGTVRLWDVSSVAKPETAKIEALPEPDPGAWKTLLPAAAPPPSVAPFDAATGKEHQEAWAEYLRVSVVQAVNVGLDSWSASVLGSGASL